jgi:hypothetical protein
VARLLAEAALDGGRGSERREHLPHGHVGHELAVKVWHLGRSPSGGLATRAALATRAELATSQRRQSRRVHIRVLAEFERREMEPERLDLPAEVLDLAECHPRQPIGDEAFL